MTKRTLCDIKKGEARILAINCKNTIKQRLSDMGLMEGVTIEYLGRAPLGDPLLIEARNVFIAIEKKVAGKIIIE